MAVYKHMQVHHTFFIFGVSHPGNTLSVTQHTPTIFVSHVSYPDNLYVQCITLLESAVKCHFPQLRAHAGLSKLHDGVQRLIHSIRGFKSIHDFNVQHPINLYGHIVLGDRLLGVHRESKFFQAVSVRHALHLQIDTMLTSSHMIH
jgi:hypothetical protein